MKLLAFADLHLGAGSSLGHDPGDRLRDQGQVLDRVMGLAEERRVDAILMAGDLFEGPTITTEQLDVFMCAAEGLAGSTPIICINGNGYHDLAMRSVNALQPLRHVPGVHVYSRPGLYDLGQVQVACLPWTSPARLVARYGGTVDRDRINAQAAQLWVRAAAELCDPTIKPTVLLFHGSISGASLPTGIPTDELREPVVPLGELLEVGYAAIVAGHIHAPQFTTADYTWDTEVSRGTLHTVAGGRVAPLPLALYTGSPMPLNFGEVGTAHGVWIIDIDDRITRAEFVPIESRPLRQTSLDLAALEGADTHLVESAVESLYDDAAWPDVIEAIVKVTLRCTKTQQRRLDLVRLRAAVLDAGAHTVKINVDTVREERSRVDSVTGELDPLEAFDAWSAVNEIGEPVVRAAREQMQADLEQVGAFA